MAGRDNAPVTGARVEIGADEKTLEKGLDAAASVVHKFTQDANRQFGQMAARIQGYVDKIDATEATVRLGLLEQAVGKLGGTSNLTAPQLTRVQAELQKLAEQGGKLPPALQAIHDQFLKGKAAAVAAADAYKLSAGRAAEAKRNLDSALGRISSLADQLSGKAAGREMAELAKAVAAAGGASKLSAPALDMVRQRLVTLQAAGAKVPPSLKAISLETDRLTAAAKAAASGQGWSGVLGAISPQAAAAAAGIAGLTAAATLAGQQIGKAVLQTATYAGNIRNQAESYNMNVVALQRLQAAAQDADVPLETVAKASSNIAKAIVETPDKVRALGLSIEDLLAMSPDQQFFSVAEAIGAIENPTLQSAAALDLLGKTGPEVLRLLKTDMRGAADEAERMGRIMSEDQVRAAAELKDELDKLDKTWEHLKLNLATVVTGNENVAGSIRVIREAVGELSAFIQENRQTIAAGLIPGAQALAAGMPAVAATLEILKLANAELDKLRARSGGRKDIELPRDPRYPGASPKEIEDMLAASEAGRRKLEEDAKKSGERMREIAARNRDLDGKASAEAMERERKRAEQLSGQLLTIKVKELALKKGISEDAARSEIEAQRKTSEWLQQRAENDTKAIAGAEAARADARRLGMKAIDAQIDKIEEATAAALAHVDALELEGKIGKEAAEKQRDAYNEAAEAEIRYARQQEALRKIGQVRELFGELVGILDELGVSAESNLGKAARVGEQLAGAAQDFTEAAIAFQSGDYLTAAVEGLKGIGGLIKAWKTAFSKPEWKKVMEDVGRDLGVSISQGLAEAIAKDSERLGDRVAATLLHLKDIIEEAGGIESFGVEKATAKLRDLFVMVQTGKLSLRDAGKAFDDVFGDLAAAVTKNGGIASAQLLELIQLQRQFGMESQGVTDFLNQQAEAGFSHLQALIESGILSVQGAADAIGAELARAFDEMIAKGVPAHEAFERLQPLIDKFAKQLEEAGLTGGAAFDALQAKAAFFADEISGPAARGISAAVGLLVSLHNQGLLNQQTFAGLTAQISATVAALQEQGKWGPEGLSAIAQDLQRVWELQQDFGYEVDESTQALLDQGTAAGLVGDQHRSAQDRMAKAMERTALILEAMARHMGVTVPEAARRGADAIEETFEDLEIPTITVPIEWDIPPFPEPPPGGKRGGDGMQSGGVVDFPHSGGLALLHGQEAVVPRGADWFMDMMRSAVRDVGAGAHRGDIYLLVDNRGGAHRLSRAEFRQIEAALGSGVIKVPQRVVSDRIG